MSPGIHKCYVEKTDIIILINKLAAIYTPKYCFDTIHHDSISKQGIFPLISASNGG